MFVKKNSSGSPNRGSKRRTGGPECRFAREKSSAGCSLVDLVCVRGRLHQLLLGALGADDIFCVSDETSAHQRGFARSADEAIVVPVAIFKRDESSAANACTNWIC